MTQNPIALPQPEMEGTSKLPSHDFSLLSVLQFVPAVSLSSPMDPVLDSATNFSTGGVDDILVGSGVGSNCNGLSAELLDGTIFGFEGGNSVAA